MVDTGTLPGYRKLVRELFWTRAGLLVAIVAVGGVGLLWLSAGFPDDSVLGNVTFALGTGLLAASVFSLAQTVIAATASNRMLVNAITDETRAALQELSSEYRSLDRTYMPTHVFEGSRRPDPAFNVQLTDDLLKSETYLFRGMSARHTAARLLAAPSGYWEVRVIIADLRAPRSIHERAQYLASASTQASFEEVYSRVRSQVRYGLAGLYEARIRCRNIFVTVSQSPSLDRFEIFDDSVWVTLYSDVSAPAAHYPRSLRFDKGSFIYAMQRRDFQRTTDESDPEVIGPSMSRADFLSLFHRLTGEVVNDHELAQMLNDFNKFRTGFVSTAKLAGN